MGSNGRECRANYPFHNCLCDFHDLLAEGEELGSNLLHVGQSTPASSCVRSSWQRRGQGHHEPKAPPPPGEQPAPSVLGISQWRNAGHPQVTSAPCPLL